MRYPFASSMRRGSEFVVARLGLLLLGAINLTLRWEKIGIDGHEANWLSTKPRLFAFWHGRQLFMPWLYLAARAKTDSRPLSVLISRHRDGRLIARAIRFLGLDSVDGSSSRGGREALFELIKRLRAGEHVAITPDGPRGPAGRVKPGVLRVAQRSGVPIYPLAYSAQRKWTLPSWDGMILPKPFAKAVFVMGPGIGVPADLREEELAGFLERIEAALGEVTARADGHWDSEA